MQSDVIAQLVHHLIHLSLTVIDTQNYPSYELRLRFDEVNPDLFRQSARGVVEPSADQDGNDRYVRVRQLH